MSQLREIKILVFSENNDFWAPQLASIRLPHKIEYAKSTDICQFLINEWAADFCIYDADSIPLSHVQKVTQNCSNKVVFIGSCKLIDNKTLLQQMQIGMDKTLPDNVSSELLNKTLSNFSRKWLHHSENTKHNTILENKQLQWESLTVYPNDYLVKVDGQVVTTSPVQFKLLVSFLTNQDQLLTRDWLKEYVWQGAHISPRSIDAQISKLKRAIPIMNSFLVNIYGKGYVLSSNTKKQAS